MKNLLLAFGLLFSLILGSSACQKNNDTDLTAWIDQLDTSVNTAQKNQLRAWITERLDAGRMEATSKLYAKASEFYTASNNGLMIWSKAFLCCTRRLIGVVILKNYSPQPKRLTVS